MPKRFTPCTTTLVGSCLADNYCVEQLLQLRNKLSADNYWLKNLGN